MSAQQTLLNLWKREARGVFQNIVHDVVAALESCGEELPTGREEKEQIAELCLDADRMNPSWSGNLLGYYSELSPESYKELLALWRTPEGSAAMIDAIDFGF